MNEIYLLPPTPPDETARMYAKMYYTLFNAITVAVDAIQWDADEKVRQGLIDAQRETEEIYTNWQEDPDDLCPLTNLHTWCTLPPGKRL